MNAEEQEIYPQISENMKNKLLEWGKITGWWILNLILYQGSGFLLFSYFYITENPVLIILLTGFLSILVNFGLFWLLGVKSKRFSWESFFQPVKKSQLIIFFWIIFTTIVLFFVRIFIGWILSLFLQSTPNNRILQLLKDDKFFWLIFFLVAIIGPVVEEFFYRGLIFKALRKILAPQWAIILSSLLFAVSHLNIIQGILAFILAIFLAVFYEKSENLMIPIIMHILNNTLSILLTYFLIK
ncbi:MAG: CPBP family intramembrane metalloprotease [Candidatus Lokiarchaeota archaeon]|nr:CPBP family intramembrane metalloprotease [Candidatus Harpocratesius repetitus]